MFVERQILPKIKSLLDGFPVVSLTGPRQSGKSTLLKQAFPDYRYLNLEDASLRGYASDDPKGFLSAYGSRVIIDEAQRAPELFSHIQLRVDDVNMPGMYILSGSQNFLMLRSISQSLAGRVGVLSLLPLSLSEMLAANIEPSSLNEWLRTGAYPRLFSARIAPGDYYSSYIETYVERDVRTETGIHDLVRFRQFLAICAARVGTPVNLTDIGRDLAADSRTITSWLSILEESYIAFRLPPWFVNIGKRQSKKPKLYFHDTGILCELLGIRTPDDLVGHDMRGYVFENAVINECMKAFHNIGVRPQMYFWRNGANANEEIDLLLPRPDGMQLIEIKSSQTARPKHASNLKKFAACYDGAVSGRHVVYDGDDGLRLQEAEFVNWRDMKRIVL